MKKYFFLFVCVLMIAQTNLLGQKQDVDIRVPKNVPDLIFFLQKGFETPYFKVTFLAGVSHLVKGKSGSYFKVDIKNSHDQSIIHFTEGEYVFDVNTKQEFTNNFMIFHNKVINIFAQNNKDFAIYIKGSADLKGNADFVGHWHTDPQYHFSTLNLIMRVPSSTQYQGNPVSITLPNPFTNRELPNYRAAFMQYIFPYSSYIPQNKVHILEGEVSSDIDAKDRNVTIYLFVAF